MPRRTSQRLRRPSTRAADAPPVQRRRHAPRATATSTATDFRNGSAPGNTPPGPPVNTGADESILPPTLLADLVTKVTAEVIKQLVPLLSSHGNTDPGPLTEGTPLL